MSIQPTAYAVRAARAMSSDAPDTRLHLEVMALSAGDAFPSGPVVLGAPRLIMARIQSAIQAESEEGLRVGATRLNVPRSILQRYLFGTPYRSDIVLVQMMMLSYSELNP